MPNVRLRYFTGTGNSLRLAETCRDCFSQAGWTVDLKPITPAFSESTSQDLLGLIYPTYAYAAPRIVRNYIEALPPGGQAFVLANMGGINGEGWAVTETASLLTGRGYRVSFGEAISMPNNWTPGSHVPDAVEAEPIFADGIAQAKAATRRILAGEHYLRAFHYPPLGYLTHAAFHRQGIKRLWRYFKVKKSCNGCGLCARACPTQTIRMIDKRPVWSASCEQCLRCYHSCPERAIGQLDWLGGAKRNRYLAPDFKP